MKPRTKIEKIQLAVDSIRQTLYEAFEKGRLVEKFISVAPAGLIITIKEDEIHFGAKYYDCIPENTTAITWTSFSLEELKDLFRRILVAVFNKQWEEMTQQTIKEYEKEKTQKKSIP